jgi:hypothetical protein
MNPHDAKIPVFIGINGSDPETSLRLGQIRNSLSHLELSVSEWKQSLYPGAARNKLLGILSQKDPKDQGSQDHSPSWEWIYFIDDDAYLPETGFTPFFEALKAYPDAAAIGGPNLTPPLASHFSHLTGLVLAHPFATYFSKDRYRKTTPEKDASEAELILCNLFVKKDALGSEPFPNELPCAEETAYLDLLQVTGARLIYFPSLYVFHERKEDFASLARQVHKYGHGRGLWLSGKKPKLKTAFHLVPTLCVATALSLFLDFFLTGSLPWIGILLFSTYAILLGFSGLQALQGSEKGVHLKDYCVVISLFVLIHFFYGTGVFHGLLSKRRAQNSLSQNQ